MEYELVYDAARDFAGWQIVAGGIALFVFLIVMIFYDRFIPRFIFILFYIWEKDTEWGRTIIAVLVLLLGVISVAIIKGNVELGSMSKKNECTQIAGMVMDFKPVSINGRGESFTLNDIGFKYDTHFMMTGFNKSAADGGPIYEGAMIRLCYIDRVKNRKVEKIIIRVETASI